MHEDALGRLETDWNVRPFQIEVLKIFRSFESLCKKHGLRYYAFGGTALGAVRHKGFIPWDDDFDVIMPREDYMVFVRNVQQELPDGLRFQRGGEGTASPIYFGKVVNTDPDIVSRLRKETNLNIIAPPFIDVFVLDGFPVDMRNAKRWWQVRRRWRYVQMYRYPQTIHRFGIKVFIARMIGALLSMFYPKTTSNEELMAKLDDAVLEWPFATARAVVETAFFKFDSRRVFTPNTFDPAREIAFEDGVIRVPAKVDELLTRYYGDYMTPPPMEHQIPEHLMRQDYNHV